MEDNRMPILFLGHGSPMNAIEENDFVEGFRKISKEIPKPKAILCISAHWYINKTKVLFMEKPRTIHDFYGFPSQLYEIEYPALGDKVLAQEIKDIALPIDIGLDLEWGLDHGAWSVLKHLYPLADIPVIQLSIDFTKGANFHFNLASKLKSLREKGVLIIGSGNIVHNLRLVDYANFDKDDYGYDWAVETRDFINQKLIKEDFQALIDYEKSVPNALKAIPSPDHYLPLIYVLGAKHKEENIEFFNDKMQGGSLSMTSLIIK